MATGVDGVIEFVTEVEVVGGTSTMAGAGENAMKPVVSNEDNIPTKGPSSYFKIPSSLKMEDLVSFERAASFTAVGENFDLPEEEVLVEDLRLTSKRPKVRIMEGFIETDLHGRGFQGAFPGVEDSEEKVKKLAKSRMEKVAQFQMEKLPGEAISYDCYGRADPRIFGEGSHIQSKKEAYQAMMRMRQLSVEQKRELYLAPAHPRLTGAPVVTKAEQERVQNVINEIMEKKKSIRLQQDEERRKGEERKVERLLKEEKEAELKARASLIQQQSSFKDILEQHDGETAGTGVVADGMQSSASTSALAAKFEALSVQTDTTPEKIETLATTPPSKLINRFEGGFDAPAAEEKAAAVSTAAEGGISGILAKFQSRDQETQEEIAEKKAFAKAKSENAEAITQAKKETSESQAAEIAENSAAEATAAGELVAAAEDVVAEEALKEDAFVEGPSETAPVKPKKKKKKAPKAEIEAGPSAAEEAVEEAVEGEAADTAKAPVKKKKKKTTTTDGETPKKNTKKKKKPSATEAEPVPA